MRYLGGKQRVARSLVKHMVVGRREIYWEPFCGAASVAVELGHPAPVLSDANEALITMWQHIQKGWEPPSEVSEDMYNTVRDTQDPHDPLTAFVGIGCSFAGKWFGGYARGGAGRNYATNARNSLLRKMKRLQGAVFVHADYTDLEPPRPSIIYCDPPYMDTTGYVTGHFDHAAFWDWCRKRHSEGHRVYVSEYAAPRDFACIAQIPTKLDMRDGTGGQPPRVEKLFVCGENL